MTDNWSTADPALTATAPHETGGLLRAQRGGLDGSQMIKLFRMKGTKLMAALQKARADEISAAGKGLPIHDERIHSYEEG